MALGGSIQSGTLLRGLELFLYSRLTWRRFYSTVTSIIRSDKKYRAGPGIRVLLLARNHPSLVVKILYSPLYWKIIALK